MKARQVARHSRGLFGVLLAAALFFWVCGVDAANPVPDVKINGLDGPVVLKPPQTATISISMDSGGVSVSCDWWFALQSPLGMFLLTPDGWSQNVVPIHQGPLVSFSNLTVVQFPVSALPPGSYTFYFAVDTVANGSVDLDSLFFDSATLIIATDTGQFHVNEDVGGGNIISGFICNGLVSPFELHHDASGVITGTYHFHPESDNGGSWDYDGSIANVGPLTGNGTYSVNKGGAGLPVSITINPSTWTATTPAGSITTPGVSRTVQLKPAEPGSCPQ
jgi:hypothetical protein